MQYNHTRLTDTAKTLALHLILCFKHRLTQLLWPGPGCQVFDKRLDQQRTHKRLVIWRLRTIRQPHEAVTASSQRGSNPSSCRLKSAGSVNSIRADTPSSPASGWVGFLSSIATSHIGSTGSTLHARASRRSNSKFRAGGPQRVLGGWCDGSASST